MYFTFPHLLYMIFVLPFLLLLLQALMKMRMKMIATMKTINVDVHITLFGVQQFTSSRMFHYLQYHYSLHYMGIICHPVCKRWKTICLSRTVHDDGVVNLQQRTCYYAIFTKVIDKFIFLFYLVFALVWITKVAIKITNLFCLSVGKNNKAWSF